MLPPLPRRSVWAYCFAHFTQPYQPSPKGSSGRPAHCPFRGLLGVHSRYGLHTPSITNSCRAFRRLQLLRYLHSCSGCFRLERLPGGACTHWKAPPLHGARQERTPPPSKRTRKGYSLMRELTAERNERRRKAMDSHWRNFPLAFTLAAAVATPAFGQAVAPTVGSANGGSESAEAIPD